MIEPPLCSVMVTVSPSDLPVSWVSRVQTEIAWVPITQATLDKIDYFIHVIEGSYEYLGRPPDADAQEALVLLHGYRDQVLGVLRS